MTTKVRSRDIVGAELEAEILSGSHAPGDRLPAERRLAEQHGVSRPMVREALRALAERGLVEVVPGRGTFVRPPSARASVRSLETHFRRGRATAREITEVRLMVECQAAALAAERGSLDDVRELEKRLTALEAAETPEETVKSDLAFHLAVTAAAHNRIMEAMLGSVASLAAELMVRSLGDPEVYRRSAPFHRRVYEAIAARDPEAARTAMHEHLQVASTTYGRDYDDDLDAMARRALRRLGYKEGLPTFLRAVTPTALEGAR
jgi:GntR family transcriptional regulator, transcriptional repressor for pyruvate dehydrogenase complex